MDRDRHEVHRGEKPISLTATRTEPEPVVPPPWSLPPGARAVLEIEAPGLRAILQDGGRRGVAAVGVPAAGPADPVSFELANRLAGNATGAAALELTGGGTRVRCLGECHVAVVGAAPEVGVEGMPVSAGQLLPLAAGQVLRVGRQHGGCRTYLSVAGGSPRARLVRQPRHGRADRARRRPVAGRGPALRRRLGAPARGPPRGRRGHRRRRVLAGRAARRARPPCRAVRGRRPDATRRRDIRGAGSFQPGGSAPARRHRVRRHCGAGAAEEGSTPSGVVTGAVQVPPDGEPVVLLPDHATLGGYPVLAVVACGRSRPAGPVRAGDGRAPGADHGGRGGRGAPRRAPGGGRRGGRHLPVGGRLTAVPPLRPAA